MIWQSAVFVRHKFWIKDWPVASLQHRALNWQANFLSVISFWKKHQNLFSVRSSIQAWFSVSLICDNKNFPAWEISVSVCQFFSCRNLFSGWKNVLICAMPCRVSWYGNTEGQVVCFKCQQVHFAEKTNPSWQMFCHCLLMPLCKPNCEGVSHYSFWQLRKISFAFEKPNLLGKCYWSAFFVWLE